MTRAIDRTRRCADMHDVRRAVDALDDLIVPLLVTRAGYMSEAARIKQHASQVHDPARIEAIVARVRERAAAEGGPPALIEAIYRALMDACIEHEQHEFQRLHPGESA